MLRPKVLQRGDLPISDSVSCLLTFANSGTDLQQPLKTVDMTLSRNEAATMARPTQYTILMVDQLDRDHDRCTE